jgi:hypothetical protein
MLPPPTLELSYVADHDLFVVRWRSATPPQLLCHDYESLLDAAPAHYALRWLLDVRHRPVPTLENLNWITLNWLPRVAARFAPGALRVAYLISAERAAVLAADPFLGSQLHDALAPNRHYEVAVFGDEAAARHWLLG